MDAAAGEAIEQTRIDALHLHAALGSQRQQFLHAAATPLDRREAAVTRPARNASRTGLMP